MKKLTGILAILLAVAVIGGTSYQLVNQEQPKAETKTAQTKQVAKISFSADKKIVKYDGIANEIALKTLRSLTDITTKSSNYGDMVTGIHNVNADPNSEYWAFYVNGKLASEGAGTYKSAKGDKIEWRLEKF